MEVKDLVAEIEKAAAELLANPALKPYHRNIERKVAAIKVNPTARGCSQTISDLLLIASKA